MTNKFGSLGIFEKFTLIIAVLVFLTSLGVVIWVSFSYYVIEPSLTTITTQPEGMDDWLATRSEGVVVAGISGDFFPFAYYSTGRLDGFDIGLMSAIVHELGMEIEWIEMPKEGFGAALQLGQIDVAISAFGIEPEILTYSYLSPAYFWGEDAVLANNTVESGKIVTLDQLSDLRIGVLHQSLFHSILENSLVHTGKMSPQSLVTFSTYEEAMNALLSNDIDVIYLDSADAESISREKGLVLVGKGIHDIQYRFAVRKGSREFLNQMLDGYQKLKIQGRIEQLERQYLIPAYVNPKTLPDTPDLLATSTPLPAAVPECMDGMDVIDPSQQISSHVQATPGQVFSKSWTLKNTGTCIWTGSYRLVFAYGNDPAARMGSLPVNLEQAVLPGVSTDITLTLIAAQEPGFYQGFWNLVNPKNIPFGERAVLQVQVDPGFPIEQTLTVTSTETVPSNNSGSFETQISPSSPIQSFRIVPSEQIYQGECVLIEWSVTGEADNIRLSRNGTEILGSAQSAGKYFDCPANLGTVMYELTILGPGISEARQEDVNIFSQPPEMTEMPAVLVTETTNPLLPEISLFQVSPGEVTQGDCVLIQWQAGKNVSRASLFRDGMVVLEPAPLSGMAQDCLQIARQVSYQLKVWNEQEQEVEKEVTVLVKSE